MHDFFLLNDEVYLQLKLDGLGIAENNRMRGYELKNALWHTTTKEWSGFGDVEK